MSFTKHTCYHCALANNDAGVSAYMADCIETMGFCPVHLRDLVDGLIAEAQRDRAPYAAEEARRLADRGEQWLTDDQLAAVAA